MEAIKLPYIKVLPTVCMPTHATPQSIDLDLYSPVSVIIPAHDNVLINTGVAFKISMGYYSQVAPHSGMALHHHIHVGAGVINPDYTGPLQVLLLNFGHQSHVVETNNRIAQLILEKITYPILCEIQLLPDTE